jgi:DNA mismatch repair protein MutS
MKRTDVNIKDVTPMMKQYLEIKEKYPDIILFFRLGDFYEMFFEDAVIASKELELALTGKNAGLDERIPMCGIPHHAASIYIDKLVNNGYKVGICEQLEDPKNVKGIVKRDITQIISSGTIVSEDSLDAKDNNFIGCLIDINHAYSLSYADMSTGEIYVTLIKHNNTIAISEIISLNIKELIVDSSIDKELTSILNAQFKVVISNFKSNVNDYINVTCDIEDERYKKAVNMLLSYLEDTQKRSLIHFQKAVVKEYNNYLKMDIHTKRNLELTETLRLKDRNYSLLGLLDKTKTAMGSRMLKNYIENPLINEDRIEERYNIVETFLKEFILKEDLKTFLYEIYDLERLSGRIAFGNANGRDLIQLKNSLKVLPNIRKIISEIKYHEDIDTFNDLYQLLETSINDNPPISIKEGYIIKDLFNHELDELKSLRKGGKDFVAKFEQEEKIKTGIKNLKVGYNRVFGYYIEISKGNVNMIKDEFGYERRQTLSNCERYISPILKEKESLILNAEEKIIELEYNLFIEIRDKIKEYIPSLQKTAKVISEIDVLQSFAEVAEINNYIRPTFSKDIIDIKDSRHPVVEKVISESFVPNDIYMDSNTNILLITGPNMAGKSTYMRQMAITSIMAQIGSYIPAKSAIIPIFDAIYTRIGASDDLVSGESTFMVEMIEANNAISKATENSLILFDELGRGTATFDGMSLAQAIIEYIHDNIKCKTLFSTHYHELTDLEKSLNNLKNIHVSAYEEDGNITFLHKIKDGSVDKSYGIHVAKLAHLPKEIISRATQILNVYENKEKKRDIKIQEQLPLEIKKSVIEEEIKKINPEAITPLDALNIIYNLKNKIDK